MSGQVQRRNAQLIELLRSEFPRSPWGCAFLAYNTVEDINQTGGGAAPTVDFDTEIFDLGNDFAADVFTAPATGAYFLYAVVRVEDLTVAMSDGHIRLVTSNRTYQGSYGNTGGMRSAGANRYSLSITAIADMDAGDTAHIVVQIQNGANTAGFYGAGGAWRTYFCGHRVS